MGPNTDIWTTGLGGAVSTIIVNGSKIIFTSEKNTATAQTWPGETDTTPGNDIY